MEPSHVTYKLPQVSAWIITTVWISEKSLDHVCMNIVGLIMLDSNRIPQAFNVSQKFNELHFIKKQKKKDLFTPLLFWLSNLSSF